MNFVKYKGVNSEFIGRFVLDKVYFSDNRISGDACDSDGFTVEADSGQKFNFNIRDRSWEFLDSVYAVVVRKFDGFCVGRVVVLDGIEDDGNLMFSVNGVGLREPADVSILDRTSLYPGVEVMERASGHWRKVEKTDEFMGIGFSIDLKTEKPDNFIFAVSQNCEIMSEPLLVCINDEGDGNVKNGGYYKPIWSNWDDGCGFIDHLIIGDTGCESVHSAWRFKNA